MPNTLVNQCRKLTVLGYLIVQAIVWLALKSTNVNFLVHLGLLVIASIAYLALALKDPGYVDYTALGNIKVDIKQKSKQNDRPAQVPDKQVKDTPLNRNLSVIQEEKEPQIGELGINSSIKVTERKENGTLKQHTQQIPQIKQLQMNPCILEGEIGMRLAIVETSEFSPLPEALKAVQRYCRVCKGDQPLRARHCLDCGKCVRAFDHHCPWINNCIGQKNKVHLMVYLTLQLVQLFGLAVDLVLNKDKGVTRQSITLWVAVTALGVALLGVFIFQAYLVVVNLTTWECLRWYRIEYLLIFSKEKLRSLFYRGIMKNILIFVRGGCSKEPINWLLYLNPRAHECLNTSKCTSTERRLNNDKLIV